MSFSTAIIEWIYQFSIAVDQLVNAIFNGSADETLSSRIYRLNHRPLYKALEKIVNVLYRPLQGPDHCKNAYQKEVDGRHMPSGFKRAWQMNQEFNHDR